MMKSIARATVLLVISAPGLAVTPAGPPLPMVGFDPPSDDGGPDFTAVVRHPAVRPLAPSGAFRTLAIVPEPRVWVLLVAGYGMVGFALRRRGLLRHVAG